MAAMMVVARRQRAMGKHIVRGWLLILGWLANAIMGTAVVVMFVTLGKT